MFYNYDHTIISHFACILPTANEINLHSHLTQFVVENSRYTMNQWDCALVNSLLIHFQISDMHGKRVEKHSIFSRLVFVLIYLRYRSTFAIPGTRQGVSHTYHNLHFCMMIFCLYCTKLLATKQNGLQNVLRSPFCSYLIEHYI